MRYNEKTMVPLIKEWEDSGYRKFKGHYKKEDYGYWKSFYEEERDEYGEKVLKYQVVFLIYDFSKYEAYPHKDEYIGISQECLISDDFTSSRVVIGSREININKFEKYCEDFFNFDIKNQ